jgi:uncharacterized protein
MPAPIVAPPPAPSAEQQAEIDTHRKRYEALKAAGQKVTPKSLPALTSRDAAPIALEALILCEQIAGGWYWTTRLDRGDALRIINTEGMSCVAIQAWSRTDPSERLNYADTVKVQWTASLRKGRVLLSDMGRVLFSIIEDTSAAHDALAGGSNAADNARYGSGSYRNTRDNFILAAAKLGLGVRDVHQCVSFFAPVGVDAAGRFTWDGARRHAGDFVDLRAEMDLLVALSNCPHPLDPSPIYAPGLIDVIRYRTPMGSEDVCRSASAEAERAYENNGLFLSQAPTEFAR